jgi:hypothetical protein
METESFNLSWSEISKDSVIPGRFDLLKLYHSHLSIPRFIPDSIVMENGGPKEVCRILAGGNHGKSKENQQKLPNTYSRRFRLG